MTPGDAAGETCGLNLTPFPLSINGTEMPRSIESWTCMNANSPSDSIGSGSGMILQGNPWGCHIVLSGGFIVTFLITLPMGYFKCVLLATTSTYTSVEAHFLTGSVVPPPLALVLSEQP